MTACQGRYRSQLEPTFAVKSGRMVECVLQHVLGWDPPRLARNQ